MFDSQNSHFSIRHHEAFTLIELLVVIAIIAILSVVVILTLNPAALLQQSRDANRVSDMATLNSALGVYLSAGGIGLGNANIVYISIPDPTATSTAGDQCQGLGLPSLPVADSYQCAASSTVRNNNGMGWIPVNFSTVAIGSPLSQLSIDPINSTSSNLYYSYSTNGTQYQLNAHFESAKYIPAEAASGGFDPAMYSIGNSLSVAPWTGGMIGYWPLNEGSGTVAYDYSGNNATGTYNGGITWVSGKPSKAILITSTSTYVSINSALNMGGNYTISVWAETTSTGEMPIVTDRLLSGNEYFGMVSGRAFSFGCTSFAPGPSIDDGSYHLISYVQTPSMEYMYVDGALVGTVAVSSCSTQNSKINIGSADSNANEYFNGAINDLRIYNRALSATEIAGMYAAVR